MTKNFIIYGYPGAGKTTQIEMLKKSGFRFFHVAVGKLLREIAADDTPLGRKVKDSMASGELVDEDFVLRLVKDTLRTADRNLPIIFDGYPRSMNQIRGMEEICREYGLDIPTLVCLKITKEEAVRRLTDRRICSVCKENFSFTELPDKEKCLKCGGKLIQREDDKPEAIESRFDLFDLQFGVIRHHYQSLGKYVEIDGMKSEDEVQEKIISLVRPI
ncbi:nucleoside monophosphate kinase [Candidatus Microgenomates bacterium]|nr:nucleoside monophosphate kinase [Candidatus Microgenomates bacterium]